MHHLTRFISKKTFASLLVVFLMVPASLLVMPQKSEASINALIGAGAGMAGCFIANGLNNMVQAGMNALTNAFPVLGMFAGGQAMVPVDPIPSEIRECSLDTIVWAFINDLIAGILRDLTVWIEGGFRGTPAFVSDLRGFVLGTAQHTFDRFIDENLAFMCEPFQFNIGLTLTRMEVTTRAERFACTLDGVVGNIDGFLSGNFADGGLDGFLTMGTTRGGNPLSLIVDGSLNIMGMQEIQRQREFDLLSWGRGFFSMPDEQGNIITPGVVIEDQINHVLGSPQRRIEVADEVNELIDALIARFVGDLFNAGSDVFSGLIAGGGAGGAGWASQRMNAYFDIDVRREALLIEIDEIIALAIEQENEEIEEAARQLREDVLALDPNDPDVLHQLWAYERTAGYLRAALAAGELEPWEPPQLDFTFPSFGGPSGPMPEFSCAANDYTPCFSGRQVTVNNTDALYAALRSAQGCDHIQLAPGRYNLRISDLNFPNLVTIKGGPGVVMASGFLTNVRNLQIQDVYWEYGNATGQTWKPKILELRNSHHIRIIGNTFVGNPNATKYCDGSDCDIPDTGIRAWGGSSNITIANTQMSKISRMMMFQQVDTWVVENNTMTDIGCDGIFFQNGQNITIHSNYMDNMRPFIYAAQGSTCHADFIQADGGKGRHTMHPGRNISIRGNVMLTGPAQNSCSGVGSICSEVQGIFIAGAPGILNGQELIYTNVHIADNVYCASGMNGIQVAAGGRDVLIERNVFMSCPVRFHERNANISVRGDPQINVVIRDNTTGRVSSQQEAVQRAKQVPGLNNCIIGQMP
jgi:hypothetical protein